jgi:DNA-binding SARP family transcriptional activator
VRLHLGGEDYTPKSKKGRALLAVLAAEERPLTRTKIIDLLWSDRQEEQARASLRTLLSDLREQFGSHFEEVLAVDRERVVLGHRVQDDLAAAAVCRSAGELFEGLDHIDPQLDEWLRLERQRRAFGPSDRNFVAPSSHYRRRVWLAVMVIAAAIATAVALLL